MSFFAVLFALLVLASAAALALPLGVVYLFELTGLVETTAVVDATLSPTFLIGVTATVLVWTIARRERRVEG